MEKENFRTRNGHDEKLTYRELTIRTDGPKTIDETNRTVEIVLATETPSRVYDPMLGRVVDEIILADGVILPKSRQVPMLNVHSRYNASDVLGSIRELRVEGAKVVGRAHFSEAESVNEIWTKVREGHITAFSAGYKAEKTIDIAENQTYKHKGREYKGPLQLTTKWRIREGSVVPIGADEQATTRTGDYKKPETREVKKMYEKLLKFLQKRGLLDESATIDDAKALLKTRGLADDATEAQAWQFVAEMTPAQEEKAIEPEKKRTEIDVDRVRREATGAERQRIEEIHALGQRFDCADLVRPMLFDSEMSADRARLEVAEHVMQRSENIGMKHIPNRPAYIMEDGTDKFRAAAVDSLLMRSSMYNEGTLRVDNPAVGHDELMGFSLRELARESLRVAGQRTTGNVLEMVGRALTTSDLPNILENVAGKSLFTGWETSSETWSVWAGTDTVSDFKQHTLPRASEMDDLDEIPEHGRYQYGDITDAKETYQIATYGKITAITRQTIINDDLGAITRTLANRGESAARKVGDVVYAVLTANAAMGDGVALFAAGHSNLVADGSGAAPGIATIAAGVLAMGTQKDLQGLRRLGIRPEYLIAPKALEGATEVFLTSFQYSDSDTIATDSSLAATRQNPYAGSYFTRVYEPRLDDADAAAWYLAGRKGKTVVAFFLNGVTKPFLDQQMGWTVDGTEYKVRIDVGAKAVDWKGLYMNDGN